MSQPYVQVLRIEGDERVFTLRLHPAAIFLLGMLAGYLIFG